MLHTIGDGHDWTPIFAPEFLDTHPEDTLVPGAPFVLALRSFRILHDTGESTPVKDAVAMSRQLYR